jgi:hypothetical protein
VEIYPRSPWPITTNEGPPTGPPTHQPTHQRGRTSTASTNPPRHASPHITTTSPFPLRLTTLLLGWLVTTHPSTSVSRNIFDICVMHRIVQTSVRVCATRRHQHAARLPQGCLRRAYHSTANAYESVQTGVQGHDKQRRTIQVFNVPGLVEYDTAWDWQKRLHRARMANDCTAPDVLLLLQHPPVYTLGRGSSVKNILFDYDPDSQGKSINP